MSSPSSSSSLSLSSLSSSSLPVVIFIVIFVSCCDVSRRAVAVRAVAIFAVVAACRHKSRRPLSRRRRRRHHCRRRRCCCRHRRRRCHCHCHCRCRRCCRHPSCRPVAPFSPWVVVKRCKSVISSQLQERVAKTLKQNKVAEKRIFGRCVDIIGKISKWVDIECEIFKRVDFNGKNSNVW